MSLPTVKLGDPHVTAHNQERDAINALKNLEDEEFRAGLNTAFVPRTGPVVHVIPIKGQSNGGQPPGFISTPAVADPRALTWSIASQSVGMLSPSAAHVGAWVAREMLATLPVDHYVLVVPCGVGSTGFTQATAFVDGSNQTTSWDPANTTAAVNLYDRAVANVIAARSAAYSMDFGQQGQPTVVMEPMIWSQGENDRGSLTRTQYQDKFKAMLDQLRIDLSHPGTYPCVVGSMTPEMLIDNPALSAPIEMALQNIPRLNYYTAYVWGPKNHTAWNASPDSDPTQRIHFSAQGQRLRAQAFLEGMFRAKTNTPACEPVTPRNLRARWVTGTQVRADIDLPACRALSYDWRYRVNKGTWKTVIGTGLTADHVIFDVIGSTAFASVVEVQVRTTNEVGSSFWSDSATVAIPPNNGGPGIAGFSYWWSTAGMGTFETSPTSWVDKVADKAMTTTIPPQVVIVDGDGLQALQFDGVDDFLSVTGLGTQRTVALVCKVLNAGTNEGILATSDGDLSIGRNADGTTALTFVGAGATTPASPLTGWSVVVVSNDDANGRSRVNGLVNNPASVGTPGFNNFSLGGKDHSSGYGPVQIAAVVTWPTALQQSDMATVEAALRAAYPTLFATA